MISTHIFYHLYGFYIPPDHFDYKLNRNRDFHPAVALVAGLIIVLSGFSFARSEISIYKKPFLRLYGQLMMTAVPGSGPLYYQGDNRDEQHLLSSWS